MVLSHKADSGVGTKNKEAGCKGHLDACLVQGPLGQ